MTPPPSAPTLTFTADSYSLPANGSTALRWTSQNATSCTASRSPASPVWTGTKGATPNQLYMESTGPLLGGQVYTYTLRCDGASGTSPITRSLNISVALPPLPPIANPISSATCSPAGNSVTISWNAVPTSVMYPLRINDTIDPWGPGPGQGCAFSTSPNDTCLDSIASLSYTRPVVPGHTYQAWMHACRPGQCSPGLRTVPYPFRCDAPTLTVGVTATPASGTAPLNSTVTASVGGSATGTINYHFYCDGANLTRSYLAQPTTSFSHVCSYPVAGTYAPRVRVERGAALPIAGSATVVVGAPPACTGPIPGLASLCSGDDSGLLANTPRTLAASCSVPVGSDPKCQYSCTPPATYNASANRCELCGQCGSLADHCPDERWDDNCGNRNVCSGGTKDCRKFWKEVAP